jgi:hypothetical protein
MTDVQRLIHEADQGNDPRAILGLAALGMRAFGSVVDAIRGSDRMTAGGLGDALLRVRDPDLVPALVPLLDDEKTGLAIVAFQALGRSRDPRAFRPLADYLRDPEKRETRRSLAAAALGDLGDPRAIPELLDAVDAALKGKLFHLALEAVVALAKLGNHEKAEVAAGLATDKRKRDLRPRASEALQYAVGPGSLGALRSALKDKYAEVRVNAVDALFYLGLPESLGALVASARDKDPGVRGRVLVRIGMLAGQDFDELADPRRVRKWWEAHELDFAPGVCHRLGRPIHLPDVIELLGEPNSRTTVVKELRIITGDDFGFDRLVPDLDPGVLDRARDWWRAHSDRFVDGALYKYGHRVQPPDGP